MTIQDQALWEEFGEEISDIEKNMPVGAISFYPENDGFCIFMNPKTKIDRKYIDSIVQILNNLLSEAIE